jgi:hypothetical protein
MKLKIAAGVVILFLGGILGLMLHSLSQMNSETIILCASNEGGIPIPSQLCEYYLFNHRDIRKDVDELSRGAGLIFILNGSNEEKKYKIAEFFIAHGLDVNGINHYGDHNFTPIYGAILLNNVNMLRFLLKHDADLSIQPPEINMTALEFARSLQIKEPAIDRSKILAILSDQKPNI